MAGNSLTTKVLLIGASGLLGRQISSELVSRNYSLLKVGNSNSNYNDIKMNLHDSLSLRKLLIEIRPTYVINTAWVTNPLKYRNSAENRTYMKSSVKLAEICVETKVSTYVGIGTSAEYGSTYGVLNCDVDKVSPNNRYGFYKNKTFKIIQQISSSSSMNFIWLRVFQAYGTGENPERLIPSLIDTLSNNDRFKIQNPSTVLDFISSRDVSNALLYCLERQIYGCVDVGTSRGTSVYALAEEIKNIIGCGQLQLLDDHRHDFFPSNLRVVSPNSRLLKEGWSPRDNLTEGLKWVISSRS